MAPLLVSLSAVWTPVEVNGNANERHFEGSANWFTNLRRFLRTTLSAVSYLSPARSEKGRILGVAMKHRDIEPTKFLTTDELSSRWKVTPMTLRRWRKAGKLATHHLGRGIRFALTEIEKIEADSKA